MTTFDQQLTGRYVSAGADRPMLDDRRVARAAFVRDTIRTIYDAEKKCGIDPAHNGSLAEFVDAAEEHLAHQPRRQPEISHGAAHQQRRDRIRKHHSVLGGVALALTLTLTGCSDNGTDPNAQDTPTTTPSTPSTSASPTPKTPEEKAAAQLQRFLEVRDLAYWKRDINFKTLNPVATGDEFLQLQHTVASMMNENVTVAGQYVHTLDEPRDRGNSILIIDCEDRSDVTWKNDGAIRQPDFTDPNGDPLRNPAPVEYTLVKDKGAWKVSDSDLLWDQPC